MYRMYAGQATLVALAEIEQLRALAKRERLAKEYGAATGNLPWWSTLSGPVRTRLDDARGIFVRVRGAHPVRLDDEIAATPVA
jgi:hypothetical protein